MRPRSCDGLAMSFRKLEAIRNHETGNVGYWLSAKIYAAERVKECSCGGKFNSTAEVEGVTYPVCCLCSKAPPKLRSRAQVIDITGKPDYIDIRHDDKGRRLIEIRKCLGIIDDVKDEIESGKFDVRKYESRKKRERFVFEHFVKEFLEFQENRYKRGEITEYSFDSIKKYSKMLVPFFGKYDLSKIDNPDIEKYRNSFTEKFSNRDMSLGWLKTILNHAVTMKRIRVAPKFEVPSTKKRKDVPDLNITREKVLPAVTDPGKREAIRMLDDYGLRPCEVRAIQYEQLSFFNKRILIDRHFSKRTLTDGRKSIKKGEKMGVLDRPWTAELEAYIQSKDWSGDPKEFLFTTSTGTALGPQDLSEAWREAEDKVGVKHSQMYGIRGAKITEILERDGLTKAKNFAGHTNAIMTMTRYDHSSENVDELIG